MTEADLTAIEERNTRAIGFNHHALTDIPRLLSEVRSLQALERTAWADYQACAAERDRLTLDLHSARQLVTDTHAALERSEAENARLRAALAALFVATKNLKLRQGILEAAEAALRGEVTP